MKTYPAIEWKTGGSLFRTEEDGTVYIFLVSMAVWTKCTWDMQRLEQLKLAQPLMDFWTAVDTSTRLASHPVDLY